VVLEARACKWWMGQVLNELCTVNHGVPEGVGQAVLDKALYKHIRSKIEWCQTVRRTRSWRLISVVGAGCRNWRVAGSGNWGTWQVVTMGTHRAIGTHIPMFATGWPA